MMALGIILDCNMKWEEQISNVIKTSSWKLAVLHKLRNKFTKKQFPQILTSEFFSKMLHASQIWLTSATSKPFGSRLIACTTKQSGLRFVITKGI